MRIKEPDVSEDNFTTYFGKDGIFKPNDNNVNFKSKKKDKNMTRVRNLFQKELKNRSSKHLRSLTGPGKKPAVMSMSNETLQQLSKHCNNKGNVYDKELQRRTKLREKRKTPRPQSVKKNVTTEEAK